MGLHYTPRNRGQVLSVQYDKECARIFIDRNPALSHIAYSLQTLHRMPSESWGHRPVLPTIFFMLVLHQSKPYPKSNLQFSVIDLQFSVTLYSRALAAQDKVYPLNDAIEVMDNLMELDTKSNSLDDAREYIKALVPWVKNDQIVYNNQDEPIGVLGAHTPFPPFHWKCRTSTQIIH